MLSWFSIFVGGGLGSLCRFGIGKFFNASSFPMGTFTANVLACLILGIILGIEMKRGMSDNVRFLFITGFCGGFSTFSTFSAESFRLFQQGSWSMAGLYIISSVLVCLISIGLGMFISRLF